MAWDTVRKSSRANRSVASCHAKAVPKFQSGKRHLDLGWFPRTTYWNVLTWYEKISFHQDLVENFQVPFLFWKKYVHPPWRLYPFSMYHYILFLAANFTKLCTGLFFRSGSPPISSILKKRISKSPEIWQKTRHPTAWPVFLWLLVKCHFTFLQDHLKYELGKYNNTHRIHVWYIYLHLVDIYGKCR